MFIPARYPASPVPQDPDFSRAAEWLSSNSPADDAVMFGAGFSELSLSKARCDLLPSALRETLWKFSTYSATFDVDLIDLGVRDLGDLQLPIDKPEDALSKIREACESLGSDHPIVIIGGDNSITAPAVLGTVGVKGGLITLDAHHDLRNYQRDGLSNGSPIRVLLDEGLEGSRIHQIGIADFANSKTYSQLAAKAGINVVNINEVNDRGVASVIDRALWSLSGAEGVYIDFDLDVIDRAFAPGAPASQPGGLTPTQIAQAAFLCGAHPAVRTIDIVEVDPQSDPAGVTVRIACLVLLSFFAGLTKRSRD